jgi:serine/alanine adding enzyme
VSAASAAGERWPPTPAVDAGRADALSVSDVDASSVQAWIDFVAAAPRATLYHDYRWRSVQESVFHNECHYLLARDSGGAVQGVLPLVRLKSPLFGDFLVSVPYLNYGGVLASSDGARDALLTAAAERAASLGVSHVELRHDATVDLALPARDDKITMLLDLPADEAALWDGFKPKLRSQIRRPEKAGATARVGGGELVKDFYTVFARNMRDLGTPVYPQRFFEAIAATFPESMRIVVVDLEGRPVAAGLTLSHRSTVEIPWASALREANGASVNMLLYWTALRDAVARGARTFDFGRSSKDSGTFKFKEQWGAKPLQLRWHYWLKPGRELPRLTPNNPKFRLAIDLWKKLPVPIANVLGPRIVKYLP